MKNKLIIGAMMAVVAGISASVQADPIAFSPTGLTSVGDTEGKGNDSLFFTPNTTITVTALGYIDPQVGGNQVGLYAVSSDTLLASANITSSDTLVNGFYYDSIGPVTLTAGVEYAIDGLWLTLPPGDLANGGVGAASDITFDGYEYNSNTYLSLGTIGYAPPIFGPNFQFVPDGGMTVAMLGMALGVCGMYTRKLRRA